VEEDRFGVGLRGQHMRTLSDYIVGTVVVDLTLYYRDADLGSTQRNVCSAPACPPTTTFTASNGDSDDGWTFGAGVAAGLDYAFSPRGSIGVEAGYRYLDATAALRNPTRTIDFDRPPHLTTRSVDAWHLGLRIRYGF
jgi:opacity protein-like surface antigen